MSDIPQQSYDVIVIGAGFAGLSAALEARWQGAEVLVAEKMKVPGGNSLISDGGIAAPATDLQEKAGIEDSAELMAQDMLRAGLHLNHPDLVRTVTEGAREAFEWTRDELGVPYFERVERFGGHSVPRCYTPRGVSGSPLIKALVRRCEALGIPLLTGWQVTDLTMDEAGKRISGVTLRPSFTKNRGGSPGAAQAVTARRGVIIAAGGYGADVAFRSAQDPRLDASLDTTNKPFATAELICQALRRGAVPVQLSQIQLGAWASPEEKGFGDGPLFADYIGFLYGLILHPDTGCRFVNEQADRKQVADALLAVGKPSVCFSDAAAVKRGGWDLSRALKKGVLKTFDTWEEAAAYYGLPERGVKDSIETFNQIIEEGRDKAFGRPIPPEATPLREPPFYGMRLWPKVHYTMGGLQIDTKARVLGEGGRLLPGLFAAGEVTGGVHGASRLGSCAITDCLVFGRIAGREAAAGEAFDDR